MVARLERTGETFLGAGAHYMNMHIVRELKLHSVLKELIVERGVSAREVARACGIPQSTLTSFLSGRSTYKLDHVLALAQHFNVTLEYLLFGDGTRPTSLDGMTTVPIFDGWAKIRIERPLPSEKNGPVQGGQQ